MNNAISSAIEQSVNETIASLQFQIDFSQDAANDAHKNDDMTMFNYYTGQVVAFGIAIAAVKRALL